MADWFTLRGAGGDEIGILGNLLNSLTLSYIKVRRHENRSVRNEQLLSGTKLGEYDMRLGVFGWRRLVPSRNVGLGIGPMLAGARCLSNNLTSGVRFERLRGFGS